jgi:hypothetical protein
MDSNNFMELKIIECYSSSPSHSVSYLFDKEKALESKLIVGKNTIQSHISYSFKNTILFTLVAFFKERVLGKFDDDLVVVFSDCIHFYSDSGKCHVVPCSFCA